MKVCDWTKESLSEILRDMTSCVPKRVRVVFGEEFSYVTSVPIQKKREDVLKQAQERIPHILEDNWDFKKERNSDGEFQVAAVNPNILRIFQESFRKADLEVEVIEP